MKTGNGKSVLGLSLVAAMLLGSSAYAGKIITDANVSDIVVTPDTQFGFGGWNFDNVNVKITDTDYNEIAKSFYPDGTYDTMELGDSFESEISTGGEVRGYLHGKDWPVGEPAGIKIINDDNKTSNGKPENCIMTSSYLDTGYLDTATPKPVICSSAWQTHKRFKINLLPTSVDNIVDGEGYGKPVEIVFNLDPDDNSTDIRRYQVLQKVNNYSGKRLKGYMVEVLDENGSTNDALTLSLGEGEGIDENGTLDSSDIWGVEDMANMSHGLWGPYEENKDVVRFDNGFFDYIRAYYDVDLNTTDNNRSMSYTGDMLGGNYQAIFGNWLPSIWEPVGVFYDEDQDPSTDNILQAFFGTAPGFTEDAWYKRSVVYDPATPNVVPVYTWALATAEDFAEWSGDWYNVGAVEDVLNLGLNYIVNVGENAAIGATFTIRITPYVDSDQTVPSYVGKDITIPTPPPTDPTDPTAPPVAEDPIIVVPVSSSGGGCTYNPNSKNFDMTFLFMMALGLLYPFRRRFLK